MTKITTPFVLTLVLLLAPLAWAQAANTAPDISPTPSPTPAATPAAEAPTGTTQVGNLNDRVKSYDRNAPRRENLTGIKIVEHVNGLFGGFEQSAGFGFGVELTTAKSIPGLELRVRLLSSTKFYRKFEAGAVIGNEHTRGEFWFAYLDRTRDHFFGIGPRTLQANQTNFELEQRSYNASFAHDFSDKVEVGAYARVANTAAGRGKNEKEPFIDVLFSGNPAVTPRERFAPGLLQNTKIFTYGAYAEMDFRNDESGLTKGGYAYARLASSDGFDRERGFDDFGWTEAELDGRVYIPLGWDKTSFALRGYADLRDPKRGSQIPFYEQPTLGGRSHTRGFQNFRFRADNLLLFAAELRQTVWAQKETRGVDAIGFIDNGRVWGDNRPANAVILANREFGDQPWRTGYGVGIQYRYNKGFAARIEFAHSKEKNQIYFSVARGF